MEVDRCLWPALEDKILVAPTVVSSCYADNSIWCTWGWMEEWWLYDNSIHCTYYIIHNLVERSWHVDKKVSRWYSPSLVVRATTSAAVHICNDQNLVGLIWRTHYMYKATYHVNKATYKSKNININDIKVVAVLQEGNIWIHWKKKSCIYFITLILFILLT